MRECVGGFSAALRQTEARYCAISLENAVVTSPEHVHAIVVSDDSAATIQ